MAYWKVRVYKVEETACNVRLDVLTGWRVEPNDVALSVPALSMCLLWHVFKLVAEVAIYVLVRFDMFALHRRILVCQMTVLKCVC